MTHVIRAPNGIRLSLAVLGAIPTIGLLLIGWLPWLTSPHPGWALIYSSWAPIYSSVALLIALFVAWQLSVRAELDAISIHRRSMFWSRSLPMNEVTSALITSIKGIGYLWIYSSEHLIRFSTYTFSRSQLEQIRGYLVAEAATRPNATLTSEPLRPTAQALDFALLYMIFIIAGIVCMIVFQI
jgi:hypothetical protein